MYLLSSRRPPAVLRVVPAALLAPLDVELQPAHVLALQLVHGILAVPLHVVLDEGEGPALEGDVALAKFLEFVHDVRPPHIL